MNQAQIEVHPASPSVATGAGSHKDMAAPQEAMWLEMSWGGTRP